MVHVRRYSEYRGSQYVEYCNPIYEGKFDMTVDEAVATISQMGGYKKDTIYMPYHRTLEQVTDLDYIKNHIEIVEDGYRGDGQSYDGCNYTYDEYGFRELPDLVSIDPTSVMWMYEGTQSSELFRALERGTHMRIIGDDSLLDMMDI